MVWGFEQTHAKLRALGAVEHVSLSELTSFHVGGEAALMLRPISYEQIKEAIAICKNDGYPFVLLGRGTNILASDQGYDGLVIRFDTPVHAPIYQGNRVIACCGMSMMQLSRDTLAHGLMGLERLAGIPGTVGGACAMNAGAYGAEIKQVIRRIRVLENGVDAWMDVQETDLGYRTSAFAFPQRIALEAEFALLPDDGSAKDTMEHCMELRREKQPLNVPSAGSTFKRPAGHFAGALIEQCGLKGYAIGDAQVSNKHAGFIVNNGHATERQITELIRHVQKTVLAKTGVQLECEIKRIGGEASKCSS